MRCIECLHHCEIIFCLAKNAIYNKRDICQWHFQILKRDKKDETMGIRNSKCSKSNFQSQFSILKIILIFLKLIFLYFLWWSTFFENLDFWNIVCTIWNNVFFYGNYFFNIRYFPENMLVLAWNLTKFCTSKKKLHNWH